MTAPDNQKHTVWDALWLHANLATMAESGMVEDAALSIHNGRIAWLGPMRALPEKPEKLAREVHDARQRWMTPGLIDCHTHLVYGGNRANEFALRLEGRNYVEIAQSGGGIVSTVRATREASEEALLESAGQRLSVLLREGVTTIEIKSGYGLDTESELKMLRVARALEQRYPVTVRTTLLGLHALPPEYKNHSDDYVRRVCEETLPAAAQASLADAVDGFCESIAFSPAQIARFFDAARAHGLPIHLHAEQLTDQGGAALAAKYRALSADHLEHVSEAGVKAMAEAGTVAVLLPGAFYLLRETRKPPVALLRRHGVPMALATDCNPGTSPVTSLLLILNMGCVLFGLTPQEALEGVTRHAARALGMDTEIGTLEPGKRADIALWDIGHPVELAYHIGYNPCAGVIRRGMYRDIQ